MNQGKSFTKPVRAVNNIDIEVPYGFEFWIHFRADETDPDRSQGGSDFIGPMDTVVLDDITITFYKHGHSRILSWEELSS